MSSPPRLIVCVDEFPVVPTNANSADPSRSGGGGGGGVGGVWARASRGRRLRTTNTGKVTLQVTPGTRLVIVFVYTEAAACCNCWRLVVCNLEHRAGRECM